MTYRVVFQHRAEVEFYDCASWWAEHRSVKQAKRWIVGFQAAINGLASDPRKCSLAREDPHFDVELRQMMFGLGRRPTHRAVFYIKEQTVHIISVRHVAQSDIDFELGT